MGSICKYPIDVSGCLATSELHYGHPHSFVMHILVPVGEFVVVVIFSRADHCGHIPASCILAVATVYYIARTNMSVNFRICGRFKI